MQPRTLLPLNVEIKQFSTNYTSSGKGSSWIMDLKLGETPLIYKDEIFSSFDEAESHAIGFMGDLALSFKDFVTYYDRQVKPLVVTKIYPVTDTLKIQMLSIKSKHSDDLIIRPAIVWGSVSVNAVRYPEYLNYVDAHNAVVETLRYYQKQALKLASGI